MERGIEDIKKQIKLEKFLVEYEGEDRVVSCQELKKHLQEIRDKKPHIFMKSGIPTLDNLIRGFEGGELNIISGITGHGKTLFCQSLTVNFAVQEYYSLWFSYEVQAQQFLSKFDENLPLFYMPMMLKSGDPKWIKVRIHEAKLKYGVRAVFIDHLHFLTDIMTRNNPSLEIGKILRILKTWALDLNIVIFLIAHTTKVDFDRELQAGDTRDSSFIEQEADNVFYIWRIANSENKSILKITKNRGQGVMNKIVHLIKVGKYLRERTKDESR